MTSRVPRSITEAAALIRTRALSAGELTTACLARIEEARALNAFITVLAERALAEARRADEAIAENRYAGPLHGIPVSVKDLIDVAEVPTSSGSRVPPRTPRADAPVVARLRQAGAIVIGKTNLHEFAFGTTSDETAFGPVRNPHDPARSAGGSSGGAAAGLIEGMCLGALGTDTGGSIRIPAAACGTVGLKPALGELSCDGVVALSTTLDHVGPLAMTVADAGLLFRAMKGVPLEPPARAGRPVTFGVPGPYFTEPLDEGVSRTFASAADRLRAAGHRVVDVQIAHAEWTPDVYLHIVLPEAACLHAQTLAQHADGYSPGVRLRLEMGGYVLAEDHIRALRLRRVLRAAVDRAFAACDILLLPTLPIPAPPVGAASVEVGATRAPVRAAMLKLTQLFNITGHPVIALPAGVGADRLPHSLQLVGPPGRTERLLDVAAAVEQVLAS